jgi:asparagine synthetase B (glutamine-hydrolysing)
MYNVSADNNMARAEKPIKKTHKIQHVWGSLLEQKKMCKSVKKRVQKKTKKNNKNKKRVSRKRFLKLNKANPRVPVSTTNTVLTTL